MFADYLQEFAVVAQRQDMSLAAAELGLSTSSLARHMASLEAELRAHLLERGASGVHLTEDGRYALSVAQKVSELGRSLERELKNA
jgi:LysR family transcriptional regulator, nitrogen assimilation regulatory protein